jgi:hypothetical protein
LRIITRHARSLRREIQRAKGLWITSANVGGPVNNVRMSDDTWTERDDALRHFAALPDGHPARLFNEFANLVCEPVYSVAELLPYVTPEMGPRWFDFRDMHSFLTSREFTIGAGAMRHVGAVWRPELGGWRIDMVGDLEPPHWLHRSPGAAASAPRYETDAMIQLVQGD